MNKRVYRMNFIEAQGHHNVGLKMPVVNRFYIKLIDRKYAEMSEIAGMLMHNTYDLEIRITLSCQVST